MAKKRKTYTYRQGGIIDVEEMHDGRYGGPGVKRQKRKKPTKEQMQIVNAQNKARRCRQRMLIYMKPGDIWATWTYEVKNRPPDTAAALKEFQKAMAYVRKEYKKRGYEVFWFRNIEQGTKGAWHIHIIINEIGGTASILQNAWEHGGTWTVKIKNCKYYDEDFTKLANYITKDENTVETKEDGTPGKPRLRSANYNISRNMPLPKPKKKEFIRWKEEVKPKEGYYIYSLYEGKNPLNGFKYRRYTMIRLNRRI